MKATSTQNTPSSATIRLETMAGIVSPVFSGSVTSSSAQQEPCGHRALALDVDHAARLKSERALEASIDRFGHLDSIGQAVRFHSTGRIHRVAPDVIAELLAADHAGYGRAHMNPDTAAHRVGAARHLPELIGQGKSHVGDPFGVIGCRLRQAANDHVRVTDRLDLLEAEPVDKSIGDAEDLVEQLHDFGRWQPA